MDYVDNIFAEAMIPFIDNAKYINVISKMLQLINCALEGDTHISTKLILCFDLLGSENLT